MEISPVGVKLGVYVPASLLVSLEKAIHNLFSTASWLVNTARNPSVKSCVKLFSKTSSFKRSRFGDAGPSFDKRVEFTPELGVDWNVTRSVVDADRDCGVVLETLMLYFFSESKTGSFTLVLRSNRFGREFKAESRLELFFC